MPQKRMTEHYNLRNIRALLTEGFTDEELRRLCYDVPQFRPVYDWVARNTGKAEIIDQLLEHADRTSQIGTLLALVEKQNPLHYEKYQPYYSGDSSSHSINQSDKLVILPSPLFSIKLFLEILIGSTGVLLVLFIGSVYVRIANRPNPFPISTTEPSFEITQSDKLGTIHPLLFIVIVVFIAFVVGWLVYFFAVKPFSIRIRATHQRILITLKQEIAHIKAKLAALKKPHSLYKAKSEEPVQKLRLDAAVPDKVQLGRAFDLATTVRQFSTLVFDEAGLKVVNSGIVQAWWPKSRPYIDLKIQINAPDCETHGEDSYSFRLYEEQDSSVFYFHLTPKKTGVISIIVLVYQKRNCSGSTRVHTLGYEQIVGSVELDVTSDEFYLGDSITVDLENEKASLDSQITYLYRRQRILLDIEAAKGINTEPHYIIEREDLEAKLDELKKKKWAITEKSL